MPRVHQRRQIRVENVSLNHSEPIGLARLKLGSKIAVDLDGQQLPGLLEQRWFMPVSASLLAVFAFCAGWFLRASPGADTELRGGPPFTATVRTTGASGAETSPTSPQEGTKQVGPLSPLLPFTE